MCPRATSRWRTYGHARLSGPISNGNLIAYCVDNSHADEYDGAGRAQGNVDADPSPDRKSGRAAHANVTRKDGDAEASNGDSNAGNRPFP